MAQIRKIKLEEVYTVADLLRDELGDELEGVILKDDDGYKLGFSREAFLTATIPYKIPLINVTNPEFKGVPMINLQIGLPKADEDMHPDARSFNFPLGISDDMAGELGLSEGDNVALQAFKVTAPNLHEAGGLQRRICVIVPTQLRKLNGQS